VALTRVSLGLIGQQEETVRRNSRCRFADITKGDLTLFELARVLVRFNHVASPIVNANHSMM
jgi:hypothetical protein